MKIIGIVGGIGSGKSRVAKMLRELGAEVLDADRVGHVVLAEDPLVQESVRARWGEEVFNSLGEVDRSAVATRVFASGDKGNADRQFLENLLHPKIRESLSLSRESLAESGIKVLVIDAALLFEAGWNDVCDMIVFVDSPREVRLARARQRGWSEEQFTAREAAQSPVEEKRRRSDLVLENRGTESDLRQSVQSLWDKHVATC